MKIPRLLNILGLLVIAIVAPPIWAQAERSEHEQPERSEHEQPAHSEHEEAEHGHQEGGHADEVSESVGPGLAVVAADEKLGIKLGEKAALRIKIGFAPIKKTLRGFAAPSTSLIVQRGEAILYVKRGEWLTMIRIKVLSRAGTQTFISSTELKDGEAVVSAGAGLVRLAHLEAFGASGDGHGH